MENPATWGPVEHAINEAIEEHWERRDEEGLSLARTIADSLREKGLLNSPGKEENDE